MDGDIDNEQDSAATMSRSIVAPTSVELIPIEDDTTESQGFLSRTNTMDSVAAAGGAGRNPAKANNKNQLQPPQEKEDETTRRDSTESLDYLDVA